MSQMTKNKNNRILAQWDTPNNSKGVYVFKYSAIAERITNIYSSLSWILFSIQRLLNA